MCAGAQCAGRRQCVRKPRCHVHDPRNVQAVVARACSGLQWYCGAGNAYVCQVGVCVCVCCGVCKGVGGGVCVRLCGGVASRAGSVVVGVTGRLVGGWWLPLALGQPSTRRVYNARGAARRGRRAKKKCYAKAVV